MSTPPLLIYMKAPASIVWLRNIVSRPEPLSSRWQILWNGGIRSERYSSHHPLFPECSIKPVSRVLKVRGLHILSRFAVNRDLPTSHQDVTELLTRALGARTKSPEVVQASTRCF